VKKLLIPAFCLFHIIAISWWTLPHSFGGMVVGDDDYGVLGTNLFKGMTLDNSPALSAVLQKYIDLTGSQQYWDFFAPHSPKYHQYLSVCASVAISPESGLISCNDAPTFSNLDMGFNYLGSDRSRLYRLTENLIKLEDPALLKAFTQYYRPHRRNNASRTQALLVLHQFELHFALKDFSKPGYRMDRLIWVSQ
jgi:hypothetical protein